jgi:hypothetical protein
MCEEMNYTKIRVRFRDQTELSISEDELIVFKISGDYYAIEYLNDEDALHRTDGPAIEEADGSKSWWVDGKRHRTDGPAYEWFDGSKEWYMNGQRHRLDGPAIEYTHIANMWWVRGINYSKEEFEKRFK